MISKRSRIVFILAVTVFALFILSGVFCAYFYQPFFLIKLVQQKIPGILFHVTTKQNYFAITFDDGPQPGNTDKILEILDKYDAKATFFIIGSRIKKHPEYITRMREKGHQIANHTYHEKATLSMTETELIASLSQTEALIQQDVSPKLFRPGSGWISGKQLQRCEEAGYLTVLGSAYVSDPIPPPLWYMKTALSALIKPGVIVILHDGIRDAQNTINVLPSLLRKARSKNLKPVTLTTLIEMEKLEFTENEN